MHIRMLKCLPVRSESSWRATCLLITYGGIRGEKRRTLGSKGPVESFPGVNALDRVDFRLENGSVHAVCGENGAGKSTLMNVLMGLYERDAGEILIHGAPVTFLFTTTSLGCRYLDNRAGVKSGTGNDCGREIFFLEESRRNLVFGWITGASRSEPPMYSGNSEWRLILVPR
jgi:hypothetical protein